MIIRANKLLHEMDANGAWSCVCLLGCLLASRNDRSRIRIMARKLINQIYIITVHIQSKLISYQICIGFLPDEWSAYRLRADACQKWSR